MTAPTTPPSPIETSSPRRPAPNRRRLWLFRSAAVLLGLSVFAVAELVCVLFDWGRPTRYDDPFVGFSEIHPLFELDETGNEYRIAASRRKYFAAESFPAMKDEMTFRIFCLGGSTVQGRPYSIESSFTTWLELALRSADERHDWDVINCGGVSYASYRLVPILEECLNYQPDLIVICTGHNEFLEDRSYAHIKNAPGTIAAPLRFAGRLRTFALARSLLLKVGGSSADAAPAPQHRPVLAAETDPILNYHNSLEAYHRDDDWQAKVVAHYEFNLRRMAHIARAAKVPVLFVLPPSNLGDCPPFKSEHRSGDFASHEMESRSVGFDPRESPSALSKPELERWQHLIEQARQNYRGDLQQSLRLLEEALEIDDQYAATWYELGKCYQRLGLHAQAREAFVGARDLDVCPLRMISSLEEALLRVAREEKLPLVDAHALLEALCPNGILDGTLLVDHVHPSFEGHQVIADALVEEMARQGWTNPAAVWRSKSQAAYQAHFKSLDDFYFLRGQRTLQSVRGWTQGRADGPPAEGRFPNRIERRRK